MSGSDEDGNPEPYFGEYPKDYFDLIIIDECHRGSARDDSNWREILEYFEPAYQIGMTATPLREDNRDTYRYFGNPIYTYSLRQGIDDGFLAPYRVHRVISEVDAAGWRPSKGDVDRFGREIPDFLENAQISILKSTKFPMKMRTIWSILQALPSMSI